MVHTCERFALERLLLKQLPPLIPGRGGGGGGGTPGMKDRGCLSEFFKKTPKRYRTFFQKGMALQIFLSIKDTKITSFSAIQP